MATKKQLERELALIWGLERARETSRRRRDFLGRSAALVRRVTGVDACQVWLLDGPGGKPRLAHADPAATATAVPSEIAGEVLDATRERRIVRAAARDGLVRLAAPLLRQGRPIGALVLVRQDGDFDPADLALIAAGLVGPSSPLAHGVNSYDHLDRERELDVVHRIDQIRDQPQPFPAKLDAICRLLCELLESEVGFVALFDLAGRELELQGCSDRDRLADTAARQELEALAAATGRAERSTAETIRRRRGAPTWRCRSCCGTRSSACSAL